MPIKLSMGPLADYAGWYEIVQSASVDPPGEYLVCLYTKQTGQRIGAMRTAANGVYEFTFLADHPDGYFVTAFDTGSPAKNMAASDQLVLSLMADTF